MSTPVTATAIDIANDEPELLDEGAAQVDGRGQGPQHRGEERVGDEGQDADAEHQDRALPRQRASVGATVPGSCPR